MSPGPVVGPDPPDIVKRGDDTQPFNRSEATKICDPTFFTRDHSFASDGETYDMNAFTAAHRTLPFNTKVRVTNVESGKTTVVRINDRGPFKDNRIIDLSLAAAKAIELIGTGTAKVRLQVVELGDTLNVR